VLQSTASPGPGSRQIVIVLGGTVSQSVRRAAKIVDAVADEPRSVSDLAKEFELHRSTMFRELQSLEEVGYVRRRKDGRFTLGLHLITLSKKAVDGLDLRGAAHDHLLRLHKVVGNTIHLAALMEHSIVYVDKVEDSSGVRMYSRVGNAVLPYCSGVGKAILSQLDDRERDEILKDTTWERFTDTTLTSREDLDRQLEEIKARGWAVDDGEFEGFINCVAVPIVNPFGVVGGLSVTAIRMARDIEQLKEHLPLIRHTAELIANDLG
jgi:DNA-binding IclR family transcriptional regulator